MPLFHSADSSIREVEKNCLMDRKNKTMGKWMEKKYFRIIFLLPLARTSSARVQTTVLLFFMETPFNKRLIDWCCKCVSKASHRMGERWKSIEMFVFAWLSLLSSGGDKLHGILFANLSEWSSNHFDFPTLIEGHKKTFRRLENFLSSPAENNLA